ncbi:MAG TPA: hypothetical protein VFH22_00815 [Rhodocyclaceae bacterium]|jgi:predicted methyltransferase|nr:hypothetical protein [Rhodocyclaceae bacterium]
MRNESDYQDITQRVIAARQARDAALGELLAGLGHTAFAGVNRGAHWLGAKVDAFLHAFLMSPTH